MKAYPNLEEIFPLNPWPLEESSIIALVQSKHPGCQIRLVTDARVRNSGTVQVWDPEQQKYVANYKYGRY